MNRWAIFLFVVEIFTLSGVAIALREAKKGRSIKVSNGTGIFMLFVSALQLFAIYRLTQQSVANNAVELGVAYAVLAVAWLPKALFVEWPRGYLDYTWLRAILVTAGSLASFAIIGLLAFAG